MANKVALLFPGQGSQTVGMGKDLFSSSAKARLIFEEADDALGEKLSTTIFEGPEEDLKRTQNTQPAILTMSVACHAAMKEAGDVEPAFVAGHSLGEYSALVATGALSFADAVRAVRARGTFMQQAVPEGEGGMAAVMGLDADAIAACCAEVSAKGDASFVAVANFNGPAQTVIAGRAGGVEAAMPALKEAGARRVLPLPVSAPFHCKLMQPVQPLLDDVLSKIAFNAPSAPVVTNVEAEPNVDAGRIQQLLVDQVTSPVRFTEIIEKMAGEGVTTFIEVGPGKALSGMVKRIVKGTTQANVDGPAGIDAALALLHGDVPA